MQWTCSGWDQQLHGVFRLSLRSQLYYMGTRLLCIKLPCEAPLVNGQSNSPCSLALCSMRDLKWAWNVGPSQCSSHWPEPGQLLLRSHQKQFSGASGVKGSANRPLPLATFFQECPFPLPAKLMMKAWSQQLSRHGEGLNIAVTCWQMCYWIIWKKPQSMKFGHFSHKIDNGCFSFILVCKIMHCALIMEKSEFSGGQLKKGRLFFLYASRISVELTAETAEDRSLPSSLNDHILSTLLK